METRVIDKLANLVLHLKAAAPCDAGGGAAAPPASPPIIHLPCPPIHLKGRKKSLQFLHENVIIKFGQHLPTPPAISTLFWPVFSTKSERKLASICPKGVGTDKPPKLGEERNFSTSQKTCSGEDVPLQSRADQRLRNKESMRDRPAKRPSVLIL